MVDRADVVPLRRRGAADPVLSPERTGERPGEPPAEVFVDVADPARVLSITWAPEPGAVQLSIGTPAGPPAALVLGPDDVLDLVRLLVEGRPASCPGAPRPLAAVLPLTPRSSQRSTDDS